MAERREGKRLRERFEQLRSERAPFEGQFRQLTDYMRPMRDEFRRMATGQEMPNFTPADITDSTSFIAVDNLVAGMLGFMSSPANVWMMLKTPDQDLNEFQAVKEWLERETAGILDSFAPANSSFYVEAPELYADTPTFGFGCQFDELIPGSGGKYFDKTFPWAEIYLDVDQHGRVDTVYRHYWSWPRQLAQRFGPETLSQRARDNLESTRPRKVEMLHCVYPNELYIPDMLTIDGFEFIDVNMEIDGTHIVRESGRREFPYQVPRWAGSGKYGYGLGRRNLPDAKTINAMDLDMLAASEWQANPSTLAPDEDVIDGGLRPVPRGITYGAINRQGRRMVDFLAPQGNLPFTAQELEQRRQNTKDAWMFSLFQMANRTGLTELEVLEAQEDKMRLMGPPMARLQVEFLTPKIARRFSMRLRQGLVSPPPEEMRGVPLEVQYTSPMARAQQAAEAQSVIRFTNGLAGVSALDPDARHVMNGEQAGRVLADGFGVPASVVNSPEEIADRREIERQQQVLAQALEAGQQGADIANKLGIAQPANAA